jgi:hypothetical protein
MRIIEQADGRGQLVGDGLRLAVDYTVTVRQGDISTGLGSGLHGRTQVEAQATIEPADLSAVRVAFDENRPLTLELKDRRKLPCCIQRVDGVSLTLMASGDLA